MREEEGCVEISLNGSKAVQRLGSTGQVISFGFVLLLKSPYSYAHSQVHIYRESVVDGERERECVAGCSRVLNNREVGMAFPSFLCELALMAFKLLIYKKLQALKVFDSLMMPFFDINNFTQLMADFL